MFPRMFQKWKLFWTESVPEQLKKNYTFLNGFLVCEHFVGCSNSLLAKQFSFRDASITDVQYVKLKKLLVFKNLRALKRFLELWHRD